MKTFKENSTLHIHGLRDFFRFTGIKPVEAMKLYKAGGFVNSTVGSAREDVFGYFEEQSKTKKKKSIELCVIFIICPMSLLHVFIYL